jgi:PilZ domain
MAVVVSLPSSERAAPRHAVDAAVTITDSTGVVARGRTRNVSHGGLCAVVSRSVARGVTVEISMALDFGEAGVSEPLVVAARVVWSTPFVDGDQVGVTFVGLTPTQRSFLDMFIRYLTSTDGERRARDTRDPFDDR